MIIAVCNSKGGNSKTTTAEILATGAKGRNLAVDLDPQANLTLLMDGNSLDNGALDLLTGQLKPAQVIQKTKRGDIIPASYSLINADGILEGESRVLALKTALTAIKGKYDNIIIDTAPGASVLLLNALAAADKVLIPLQADLLSIQGLAQIVDTANQVKAAYNPGLEFAGIFFTRYNARTLITQELTQDLEAQAKAAGVPVLPVYVPESVYIKESQLARESLFQYAPKSKPAKEYKKLIEILGLV